MKIGFVGLPRSGKTTYALLLAGLVADSSRFLIMEPNVPIDLEILRDFKIIEIDIMGRTSIFSILNYIKNFWFEGRGTERTLPDRPQLDRHHVTLRVPIYRKRKTIDIKLDIPDPSGEALRRLKDFLDQVEKDRERSHEKIKNIKDLRNQFMQVLERAINSSDTGIRNRAGQILELIKPDDYDGIVVFIDPQEDPFDVQPLLYATLKILLAGQKKRPVIIIIFSKIFACKYLSKEINRDMFFNKLNLDTQLLEREISSRLLDEINFQLDLYADFFYKNATRYFEKHYGWISMLIR
ncbi:MAG: hypothetical protein ABGF52_12685, partial [Candidatus Asgardarchaeum sp.]